MVIVRINLWFADAIYLACTVDGGAHLIATEDYGLRSLGDE
jgi:hypothetical protein